MKSLYDKITAQKCQKHNSKYCFIYKGAVYNNEPIYMCDECINPLIINELLHIKKVFKFLKKQQIQGAQKSYECRAILWQQFQRSQVQIQSLLITLEDQMEKLLNSIFENQVIKTLREDYIGRAGEQCNIDNVGQYLCSVIDCDNQGQYHIKQETYLKEHNEYIKCLKSLQKQKDAIDIWNYHLGQQLDADQLLKMVKPVIQTQPIVEQNNYNYETAQTLKLESTCIWLSFNKEDNQIIAASENTLHIFYLQCMISYQFRLKIVQQQYEIMYLQSNIVNIRQIQNQQAISQNREWILSALLGHNNIIRQAKFNHNSSLIASCGIDLLIILWSKHSDGKWFIHSRLGSPQNKVYSVCFNHDSTLLASGCRDMRINIYTLTNGNWKLNQSIEEDYGATQDVCFNHDSTILASGGCNWIRLWKLDNQGQWQKSYELTQWNIKQVKFNDNSTQLICNSDGVQIKIWQLDQYENKYRYHYINNKPGPIILHSQIHNKIWLQRYQRSLTQQ